MGGWCCCDGFAEADDGKRGFLEGAETLQCVFYALSVCHDVVGGSLGSVELFVYFWYFDRAALILSEIYAC